LLSALVGRELRPRLPELVHEQTEGNPLFVHEVARSLAQENSVYAGDTRGAGRQEVGHLDIPAALREVIGTRLGRLSPACRELLTVAAVIGREFPVSVAQSVGQLADCELDVALAEAKGASIVEERLRKGGAISYWFTHAFFRQRLYEEIVATRRIRLHKAVADALEIIYVREPEPHAVELSEHFAYSSDPVDLAKVIRYGELAADQALAVQAYWEAAHHLEQCLQAQQLLDPSDKPKRCDLLLALANALVSAGDLRRVINV
jgi:predicted ATPase